MFGLTSLEVYNSVFNITEEKNEFELFTDTFDEFPFEELEDELEEILDLSDITSERPQDEILGRKSSASKKLETEMRQTDGYYMLLMGYARSSFRNFESYLRIIVGLNEDYIQLISKQYNINFVTYEMSPVIYSIKDISETVHTMCEHDGALRIEYDDISIKTKFILTRFGGIFGTLCLDEKFF